MANRLRPSKPMHGGDYNTNQGGIGSARRKFDHTTPRLLEAKTAAQVQSIIGIAPTALFTFDEPSGNAIDQIGGAIQLAPQGTAARVLSDMADTGKKRAALVGTTGTDTGWRAANAADFDIGAAAAIGFFGYLTLPWTGAGGFPGYALMKWDGATNGYAIIFENDPVIPNLRFWTFSGGALVASAAAQCPQVKVGQPFPFVATRRADGNGSLTMAVPGSAQSVDLAGVIPSLSNASLFALGNSPGVSVAPGNSCPWLAVVTGGAVISLGASYAAVLERMLD